MFSAVTGADRLSSTPMDVLIEAGPTDYRAGGPGLAYMRAALAAGRHVIAISGGALAFDGAALRAAAAASRVQIKVSGATGAALPWSVR